MSYALVDNSTLTAVQRLTGEAPTRTKDSTDADIVALENLVQAILFFDRVVALDNYVPEHRDKRIDAFSFVEFLNPEDFNINAIEAVAEERAEAVRPEIRGGEFANDDFKKLLELLQTHIVCTWDISNSIYFLTLKCLAEEQTADFDKYGNIAAAIFTELGDAADFGRKPPRAVKLVDRYGKTIEKDYAVPGARWGDGSGKSGGTTGAIPAFVAALVWLSNRSIFYTLVAKYLQADTFLLPDTSSISAVLFERDLRVRVRLLT